MLAETDARIDREEWPELWDSLSAEWLATAVTLYLLVYGNPDGWETTARFEPMLSLHHLRCFLFLTNAWLTCRQNFCAVDVSVAAVVIIIRSSSVTTKGDKFDHNFVA